MLYTEIVEKFKQVFPFEVKNIKQWRVSGKDTVMIEMKDGRTLFFKCHSNDSWELSVKDKEDK